MAGALPAGAATTLSPRFDGGVDLSGGQWQRVAFARALMAVRAGARVLILDEPTAHLDVRSEAELYDSFLELTRGLTTVVISHRFSTVRRADRIVVLRDGRTRQIGTPEDLYARPQHPDVAEFMGYRNLIESVAERTDEGIAVRIGGARLVGTSLETIGPRAVAAIRPEDLTPTPDGPIAATVEAAEYRGRDFYGFARAGDGTELFFRSEARVQPGDLIRLGAAPSRVLIYAAGGERV